MSLHQIIDVCLKETSIICAIVVYFIPLFSSILRRESLFEIDLFLHRWWWQTTRWWYLFICCIDCGIVEIVMCVAKLGSWTFFVLIVKIGVENCNVCCPKFGVLGFAGAKCWALKSMKFWDCSCYVLPPKFGFATVEGGRDTLKRLWEFESAHPI